MNKVNARIGSDEEIPHAAHCLSLGRGGHDMKLFNFWFVTLVRNSEGCF